MNESGFGTKVGAVELRRKFCWNDGSFIQLNSYGKLT